MAKAYWVAIYRSIKDPTALEAPVGSFRRHHQ
jgi:hypothetical protein